MNTTTDTGVRKLVIPIGKKSVFELVIDPGDHEIVHEVLGSRWPFMALLVRDALRDLEEEPPNA